MPPDRVTFYICDVVTGVVLDELPITGEVVKTRGEVESASWELPVNDERMPPNWHTLIEPIKTMVVAVWQGNPIQAWIVVSDTVGDKTLPLQGASLEHHLEKVWVQDGDWFSMDGAQIAAEICAQVLVPDGGYTVQWTPTGLLTDANHTLDAQVSVFSALETLQAAEGGPVWMVTVTWVPGLEGKQVEKVIAIGPTLGNERPEAIFTARAGEYTRTRDWTGDNGALEVWAFTEGSSGLGWTPGSLRSHKLEQGYPPWQGSVSFADTDDLGLASRQAQALNRLQDGTTIWDATLRIDEQPVLGREWSIGDRVTLRALPGPYDPVGGELVAEVQGWVLDDRAGTIRPRMVQESGEVQQ